MCERVCIVCKQPCVDNAPYEDRWSWGPDEAHCHKRCEGGFWEALAEHDRKLATQRRGGAP